MSEFDRAGTSAAPRAFIVTGIATAAFALGASVFALVRAIDFRQSYPEFVTGMVGWTGESKAADLWALPAATAAALFAGAIAFRIVEAMRRAARDDAANAFAGQLIAWSLPAVIGFGSLWSHPVTDTGLFHLSAIAITALAIGTLASSRTVPAEPRAIGVALFGAALVALIPLELAVCWMRFAVDWTHVPFDAPTLATAIAAFAVAAVLLTCRFAPRRIEAIGSTLSIAGCAGLPLFFMLLYRERMLVGDGGFFKYPSTRWLMAMVIALALWAWIDVARRAIASARRAGSDPIAALSPIALFALIVALRYGHTYQPWVFADDFHWGEKLLGWSSALRFGALPFVDIVPLHGMIDDDFAGYLSALFFDGTAATQIESERLASVVLSLGAYLALWRATSSVALAFAGTAMLGGRLAWLFLTPFFCLAADASLHDRPARWLVAWIVAVPIVLLGAGVHGFIWVVATVPLAAWACVVVARSRVAVSRVAVAAGIVATAVVLFATPLGAMLSGLLRYALAYGPVNDVAYALPWDLSWQTGNAPFITSELIRMSWVVAPLLAGALALLHLRRTSRRAHVLAIAIPSLVFMVAMVPYVMGRIDPGGISRPGVAANLAWCVLVPLMAAAAWPAIAFPAAALATAFAASTLGAPPTVKALVQVASPRAIAGKITNAALEGVRPMGLGLSDDAHRGGIRRLIEVFNRELAPGETYVDLTSRAALYFYTGRRPPIAVPAPYNLVPVAEQQRAIERLERERPPLALVSAQNIDNDGGGVGVRAPLLFRYVLEHYRPASDSGFVIGRRLADRIEPASMSADSIALFDAIAGPPDLAALAVSWGRSFETLQRRATRVYEIDSTVHARGGTGASGGNAAAVRPADIELDLAAQRVVPARAGLLAFEFHCDAARPKRAARVHVEWWGERNGARVEPTTIHANAAEGMLVFPLDGYVRYLALESLLGLRIGLDTPGACTAIDIRNIALLQRRSLDEAVPRADALR